MTHIIMATKNPAKTQQIRDCLQPIGIDVMSIEKTRVLPIVEETGKTVLENAILKATAYSKALNEKVISMDNALYIDGLPPEQQPGLFVRRINGAEAGSDQELLQHFVSLIGSLGDHVTGYWEFGICIAEPDGTIANTVIKSPRVFTTTISPKMVPGYPLESIQIDPSSGKHISEMNNEEQARFWQSAIGEELQAFVKSSIKDG